MTVSGFFAGAGRRFCWRTDNHPPLPGFCIEIENGFVARRIVSSRQPHETKCVRNRPRLGLLGVAQNPRSTMAAPGANTALEAQGRFWTFLWWRDRRPSAPMNRDLRLPNSSSRVQLLSGVARWYGISTKDNVVGNRNIGVCNNGPTRKLRWPSAESLAGPDGFPELRIDGGGPLKADRESICGAMSEQHGDSGRGNQSLPQKLVHLVGFRDPNARSEPWVRPRPASSKR